MVQVPNNHMDASVSESPGWSPGSSFLLTRTLGEAVMMVQGLESAPRPPGGRLDALTVS